MIKIASFPLEKASEANDFIAKNPPRSTEKQSGVIFHNGSIVVIYDDGETNPEERTGTIRTQLEGDKSKLLIIEQSLKTAEIALEDTKPKGYVQGMSHNKLKECLVSGGYSEAMLDASMLQSIQDQITNLDNEIRMDKHEQRRIGYSIKAWEMMLNDK